MTVQLLLLSDLNPKRKIKAHTASSGLYNTIILTSHF